MGREGRRVVGSEGWGPKGGGRAQNSRVFFSLSATIFFLSSLFLGCLKRRGAQMCAFWSSRGLSCGSPGGPKAAGGFTRQPEGEGSGVKWSKPITTPPTRTTTTATNQQQTHEPQQQTTNNHKKQQTHSKTHTKHTTQHQQQSTQSPTTTQTSTQQKWVGPKSDQTTNH